MIYSIQLISWANIKRRAYVPCVLLMAKAPTHATLPTGLQCCSKVSVRLSRRNLTIVVRISTKAALTSNAILLDRWVQSVSGANKPTTVILIPMLVQGEWRRRHKGKGLHQLFDCRQTIKNLITTLGTYQSETLSRISLTSPSLTSWAHFSNQEMIPAIFRPAKSLEVSS